MAEQIYSLIGQAMRKISAIGKDSVNQTQGFKYRGIDAVMNMLYPVMSELGIFVVPEVLEQTREERTSTKSVWDREQKQYTEKKTTLLYSILKTKYTFFAPDGSSVSAIVVGEGMDSGDKASNKALAVALKYACFQTFMIPTEDMIDPDSESHEVDPQKPAGTPDIPRSIAPADVERAPKLPESNPSDVPPADPVPPVLEYLAKEREALRKVREIGKAENNAIWKAQIAALTAAGLAPDKPLTAFTMDEAKALIEAMYANFTPTGTVLKDESKPS